MYSGTIASYRYGRTIRRHYPSVPPHQPIWTALLRSVRRGAHEQRRPRDALAARCDDATTPKESMRSRNGSQPLPANLRGRRAARLHSRTSSYCDARSERRYSTARGRQSRVRPAYVSASRDAGTVALSCSRHHSTGMTHGPTASAPRSSCSASRVIAAKDEWLVVEWGHSIRAAGWLRAPKHPAHGIL